MGFLKPISQTRKLQFQNRRRSSVVICLTILCLFGVIQVIKFIKPDDCPGCRSKRSVADSSTDLDFETEIKKALDNNSTNNNESSECYVKRNPAIDFLGEHEKDADKKELLDTELKDFKNEFYMNFFPGFFKDPESYTECLGKNFESSYLAFDDCRSDLIKIYPTDYYENGIARCMSKQFFFLGEWDWKLTVRKQGFWLFDLQSLFSV